MSKRVQILLVGLVCFLLGALAAPHLPFVRAQDNKVKAPDWKHGMELRVRKAGEADFTKDTKKYGLEAFRDETGGNLIYISEAGGLAVLPGGSRPGDQPKTPAWKQAMELSVSKAGEAKFTKDTKKFGVEVFKDDNNGALVYVCETGSIAAVPGGNAPPSPMAKAPDWKHGMEVKVRKAGETDF